MSYAAVTIEGGLFPADLMDRVVATLKELLVPLDLRIPYDRSDLVAQCYEYGRVIRADYQEDSIHVEAEVTRDMAGRLAQFRVQPAKH